MIQSHHKKIKQNWKRSTFFNFTCIYVHIKSQVIYSKVSFFVVRVLEPDFSLLLLHLYRFLCYFSFLFLMKQKKKFVACERCNVWWEIEVNPVLLLHFISYFLLRPSAILQQLATIWLTLWPLFYFEKMKSIANALHNCSDFLSLLSPFYLIYDTCDVWLGL